MRRLSHAITILANVTIILVGLLVICSAVTVGLGYMVAADNPNGGQGGHVAEADLYIKNPKPPEHPLQERFPELFATEAIVVSFGADWCGWCKAQARELKGPSFRYNILYVKIEDKDGDTKWAELIKALKLGEDSVPVTAVICKGEVVKVFYGFTPWVEIKPHAGKAKKNEQDETNSIDIGPIHIDWDDDGVDINRHRRNRNRK